MSFSYANPSSGPSAGGIGWFNFGNLTLSPGQTIIGLTGTLRDGTTVTFDLTGQNPSGASRDFIAATIPTYPGTPFGNAAYTGILGNTALYSTQTFLPGTNGVVLSNIVVKDAQGAPVPDYTVIVADAESTGTAESWDWTTNGTPWELFTSLGTLNPPVLTGLGTLTATITGTNSGGSPVDYLLSTKSPTGLVLNTTTTNLAGGREAIAVGFSTTKVTLMKVVGTRIDSTDQFVLNIAGNPSDQATTIGSSTGLQTTEFAQVYATPGSVYTLNEAMAPLSGSTLSAYTVLTAASNLTPGGTMPILGALPLSITPALGDNLVYGITNAAPQVFTKTVDKIYADIGNVLTYTVAIKNPNDFTVNNVFMTDTTPVGTSYLGNLVVSAPYSGASPDTGLTITAIGPHDTVTVSWQVQVTAQPFVNPVLNLANITVPGGTSGNSNVVGTLISHAVLSTLKSVDKAYAGIGDVLTYTLMLTNSGNVTANNIVLTDPIPAGTTYVAGSVTGTVPFTGTPATGLTLTAPIPAGGSATITYKVKVGATVPATNPIPNTAAVTYAYRVDPAKPNGVTASGISNTVNTLISNATLITKKVVDKVIAYVGDIITYQVSVTNSGNVPASNVILTDSVPNGTTYVAGSLAADVAFTGTPLTTIHLTNAIAPGETVSLTYQVLVATIPNPNPIPNTIKVVFTYTVNPLNPNGVNGTSTSNTVNTVVFRNNYSQEISDLIHSIALEEAAIGNIANAEGAKIQWMLALGTTPNELLCVNKSVSDMLEALDSLESVLKQKLSAVDCQITPTCIP